MGSAFSIRTQQYIIGDISQLPPPDQKIYDLSRYVFQKDDTSTCEVAQKHGDGILGLAEDKWEEPKLEKDSSNLDLSQSDVRLEQNVDTVRQGKTEICLFNLLLTEKPFYYSQSFSLWKRQFGYENLISCCLPLKTTIYIQPVDNFPVFIRDFELKLDNFDGYLNFFTLLQTFAEAFFDGMNVRILPNISLIESGWNIKSRVHQKTGQKQLLVSNFFPKLKKVNPADGYCIMGISWTDLYPTEDLNFVLGEANNAFKSGIFCFGRYEPKTFDPETHADISEMNSKLMWRILKVFSHELCHLFAMQHCWYFSCAMNESHSMSEAASQPLFLCPVCLRKLQFVCEFDVTARYRKLLRFMKDLCVFYPSEEFKHTVSWLQKCISFLESDKV